MRILVYLLTLLMVFAPTYSAYASGITKGQITQMGKKGGALVKTGAGKLVKLGKVGHPIATVGAAIGWCAKYKKKCDEIIDETVEIACDISGVCTAERKEESDGQCVARFGDDKQTASGFLSSKTRTQTKGDTTKEYTPSDNAHEDLIKQGESAIASVNKNYPDWRYYHGRYNMDIKSTNNKTGKSSTGKFEYYVQVWVKCGDLSDDDRRISDKELNDLAKKIAEKMDDDDIVNYYNTDYDDVTINNNHYYGDDIDNETNIDNQCQNNSCNEISKEIEKDVKNGKYDIDDVTPANCTMEENTGKYIACNMNIENEEDKDTNKKDGDDTDIPKKEDDEPLTCDSSKFHKKICEWMDWTQDDLDVPDEDKPKIKDLSDDLQIDKNRVNFGRACPVGDNLALSLHGVSISHQISYQGLCDAFTKMRPFIIGIGGIISVMIIGGRRV